MMRLIEDDQIPRHCLIQDLSRTFCTPHQLAGSQNDGFIVPLVWIDTLYILTPKRRRLIPLQAMPVIDRPIQIELLSEFQLPLLQHALRGENQNPLGSSRQPSLAQQQPGFNRLSQAHFVGNQELGRPLAIHALECFDLMRPWLDSGRGFSHTFRGRPVKGRRVLDVTPQHSAQFCGIEPIAIGRSRSLDLVINHVRLFKRAGISFSGKKRSRFCSIAEVTSNVMSRGLVPDQMRAKFCSSSSTRRVSCSHD